MAELGVPVAQPELSRGQPAAAGRRSDKRALEHAGEVAAVGARVHPHATADRAGNRAGELESPEPGCARAVQGNGVGRPATSAQQISIGLDRGELAAELQDERVDAFVRREEVRAQTDDRDVEASLLRPLQELLDFSFRLRPSKGVYPAAGA